MCIKTKSISTTPEKTCQFQSLNWNQVNFDRPQQNRDIFGPHTNPSQFRPPTQKASKPLYARKDDTLTPTTYTSSLLCDCYAVVTDDVHDLIAAHFPEIYCIPVFGSPW